MNSRTAKFASLGMALLFLFAGVAQAVGSISCSMPCCQEKSDSCHTVKQEPTLQKEACCGGTTAASFSLGSGCGPERRTAMEFSTVSHSPTSPPQGVEISIVEAPPIPSQCPFAILAATAPTPKAPLYLRNVILLI